MWMPALAVLTVWPNKNLQIPEHANNRTVPSWLFGARLSARDRLTSSHPDAILVTPLPTKKPKLPTTPHLHQVSHPRQPSRDVHRGTCPHPPTQNAAKVIKTPKPFQKKLNNSALTKNPRSITTAPNLSLLCCHNHDTSLHPVQTTTTQIQDKSSPQLALKVADWKKIAYTDGSCIGHDHQQIIGAGVYIPNTNRIHQVNPKSSNITNTVHRAELAGIAAAVTHDYFLTATAGLR